MAEITQQEVDVLRAAEKWWASKTDLPEFAHLDIPLVNCVTPTERELALAVAATVRTKLQEVEG